MIGEAHIKHWSMQRSEKRNYNTNLRLKTCVLLPPGMSRILCKKLKHIIMYTFVITPKSKIRILVKADFIMHFSLYRDTDFDIILQRVYVNLKSGLHKIRDFLAPPHKMRHYPLTICPQAIISPALPDGWVVKSSTPRCMITVLPIMSFILKRPVNKDIYA